jgi:hypothetical protein
MCSRLLRRAAWPCPPMRGSPPLRIYARGSMSMDFPHTLRPMAPSAALACAPSTRINRPNPALRALYAPPGTLGAFKRLAIYRDPTLMGLWVRRERPAISVQRSVSGVDVNSAIFRWQGHVLASINVKALATRYERGPSTVVRRIQNAAMDRAAKILASRLKLSGFYGLDFILEGQGDEEQSGTPWLIEMNSRATQIAHLDLGPGHELAAAAYAAVGDVPVHPRQLVTTENTIALFPQEWERDPASPLIRSAYHDVPWDAPRWYAPMSTSGPPVLARAPSTQAGLRRIHLFRDRSEASLGRTENQTATTPRAQHVTRKALR